MFPLSKPVVLLCLFIVLGLGFLGQIGLLKFFFFLFFLLASQVATRCHVANFVFSTMEAAEI